MRDEQYKQMLMEHVLTAERALLYVLGFQFRRALCRDPPVTPYSCQQQHRLAGTPLVLRGAATCTRMLMGREVPVRWVRV